MTTKIGGSSSPCTKRQNTICASVVASAIMSVGTSSANMAKTMTRLRPIMSATAPVKGATSATARVVALTRWLASTAPTLNCRATSGSTDCGA